MRDLKQKKVLLHQERVIPEKQKLRTQERTLFSSALFSSSEKEATPPTPREEAEWRALIAMVLLLFFGGVMVLISIVGNYGLLETAKIKEKEQQLYSEIEQLENRKQVLTQEIIALRSNVEYVELIAKQELGLIRTNEHIYYWPASKDSNSTSTSPTNE
ncbi:septum formation initiator family protein [Deltaproteobacteria bacterium TL4]